MKLAGALFAFVALALTGCGGAEPSVIRFESTDQQLLPEGGRVLVGVYRPVDCFLIEAGGSMRRGLHSSFADIEDGSVEVIFDFEAIAPGTYTLAAFGRTSGGTDTSFACQTGVTVTEGVYVEAQLELMPIN